MGCQYCRRSHSVESIRRLRAPLKEPVTGALLQGLAGRVGLARLPGSPSPSGVAGARPFVHALRRSAGNTDMIIVAGSIATGLSVCSEASGGRVWRHHYSTG